MRHQRAFLGELGRHDDPEAAVKGIVRMHIAWCVENPGMARFLATISEPAVLEAAEGSSRTATSASPPPFVPGGGRTRTTARCGR